MVTLRNISISFNSKRVFSEINYSFQKGNKYLIYGLNGSGKSTLFKIMLDLIKPDSGTVEKPKIFRIGYLHQEDILLNNLSVIEHLSFIGSLRGMKNTDTISELSYFEKHIPRLKSIKNSKIKTLSTGNRKLVSLIIALFDRKNLDLLVLDEPFANLDTKNINAVLELIEDFCKPEKLVLIAEHQSFDYKNLGYKYLTLQENLI